jgi:hypothetical protein
MICDGSVIELRSFNVTQYTTMVQTARRACIGLLYGLQHAIAALSAVGLQPQLLECYHILRAIQANSNVEGVALALPTVVNECLMCGLIGVSDVVDCLSALTQVRHMYTYI